MAKNKGTHGKGKSAFGESDEFVEGVGGVVAALRPHAKLLTAVGILAASGLLGFAAFHWHINKERAAASALYGEALRMSLLPVLDDNDDGPEGIDGRPEDFASAADRDQAVSQVLGDLERRYPESRIYAKARPMYASSLLRQGKYDEAAALYRASAQAASGAERQRAIEGLGYTLEAKATANPDEEQREAGLEMALREFELLSDATSNSGEAQAAGHYHAGRILAALGRNEEAVSRLSRALEVEPDTWLKPAIEERLAGLRRLAAK